MISSDDYGEVQRFMESRLPLDAELYMRLYALWYITPARSVAPDHVVRTVASDIDAASPDDQTAGSKITENAIDMVIGSERHLGDPISLTPAALSA